MAAKRTANRFIIYSIFLIQAFVVFFPIYSMVTSSLKRNIDIFQKPMTFPHELFLGGYEKALIRGDFGIFFTNSLLVTLITVTSVIVISSLAAFALGIYEFRFRKQLYFFFLAGVVIPIRLGVLNLFETIRFFGLIDNLFALIFIYSAMSIPMAMFILTPLVKRVPQDLIDAARIDGSSSRAIYRHIVFPIIRPSLATVAILTFLPVWNDFFFPLIFIRSKEKMTIPLGVATLFGQFSQDLNTAFAMLSIASIPAILFYLLAARHFIRGVTAGAIKG